MGNLISTEMRRVAKALDSADNASAALYEAARDIMLAGQAEELTAEYLKLCQRAIEVRMKLPDRVPGA